MAGWHASLVRVGLRIAPLALCRVQCETWQAVVESREELVAKCTKRQARAGRDEPKRAKSRDTCIIGRQRDTRQDVKFCWIPQRAVVRGHASPLTHNSRISLKFATKNNLVGLFGDEKQATKCQPPVNCDRLPSAFCQHHPKHLVLRRLSNSTSQLS